jgi:hypothetical protein
MVQCLLDRFIKYIGYKGYIGEEKSLVIRYAGEAKLLQYLRPHHKGV